ncbi:MFS transporter [Spirochaeta dissipatitropha]
MKRFVGPFVFLAAALFLAVSSNESYNLLPKHFSLQGVHPSASGFVMSFSGLGGIIVLPFLAFFIDHFRARTILTVALLFIILTPLLYFLPVPAVELYAIPRGIQGAMFSILMVSFTAAVSHSLPEGKRSHGLALFGLMGQAGGLTAVALGEPIFDAGGLRWLYIFSFSLSALALISIRLFPEERKIHVGEQPKLSDFATVLGRRSMIPPLFWIFILGSAFGTIQAFLPDVVLERGLGMVRPFYIAYPVTTAVVRIGFGRWFDRFPLRWVVLIPLILIPASQFAVFYAPGIAWIAFSGFCYGVSHGVMFPAIMGHLLDRSPSHFRGRMSSVFNMLFSAGLFASGNLGRAFIRTSAADAFFGMMILSLSGVLLLIALQFRKTVSPQ